MVLKVHNLHLGGTFRTLDLGMALLEVGFHLVTRERLLTVLTQPDVPPTVHLMHDEVVRRDLLLADKQSGDILYQGLTMSMLHMVSLQSGEILYKKFHHFYRSHPVTQLAFQKSS